MSISRRHLLSVAGGLAATSALAACGSNTGRTDTSASAATGATAAALAVWYHKYGEDGVEATVKKWASDYAKAKVSVNWVAADYEKTAAAALLTSSGPDVFEWATGPSLDMIQAKQVVDLTDIVGSAKADFTPTVMKRLTYQDKIWAVPQTVDMHLLYYRPSLLKAAGLSAPKTIDDLIAAANALKTKDMGGFFAGNDGGIGVLGSFIIWAAGLEQIGADGKSAGFNTTALYDAVAKFKTLFDAPGMLKSASTDWYDATPFINGETAMQWAGLWDMTKVKAKWADDFAVIPFPAIGSGGRQVVPFGAYSSCVSAKAKDVDAAKAYVKSIWVDDDAKQVDFSNSYGTHIPAKPKLFAQASKVASGPGADAAKFVTDFGHIDDILWTPASGQAYSTALSNVVKSGKDAATEFTAAADKVAAELKRVAG
jgi:multiple sugar transport system substrate-binding protein